MLCQRIDSNKQAHEIHRKHAEQMLKPGGCLLFLTERFLGEAPIQK